MKVSESVKNSLRDMQQDSFDSALLHACIAVDATARKSYPQHWSVGRRFVTCIRDRYWILEAMIGPGFNLADTKFPDTLKKNNSPDLAEIIYEILRCSHAHGDEVPEQFSVIPGKSAFLSEWVVGADELHMPDKVVFALLAIAVFSKANRDQKSDGTWFLSLGDEHFPLVEWWGREDDFRPTAAQYNQTRVSAELLQLRSAPADGATENVINLNPPFL
jgi:hypothetical protein